MADRAKAEVSTRVFTPPYPAFSTLNSFLTNLGSKPIPPRIDRSLMVGIANGVQTQVLAALREFELIDEANQVSDLLVEATRDDRRQAVYRKILTTYYADQMALSQGRGTAAQLAESFKPSGYTGSTLRKAITFFLNLAAAAEVPLSPHFRPPTQRTAIRKRHSKAVPSVSPDLPPVAPVATHRNAVRTELPSGGSLTLVCEVDFVNMSRDDRAFMYHLVDELNDYGRQAGTATQEDTQASIA